MECWTQHTDNLNRKFLVGTQKDVVVRACDWHNLFDSPFFPFYLPPRFIDVCRHRVFKGKKWANLKFVASVNLHQKAFIFSSLAVYSLSLFISSLSLCVFCSLTLLLYPHTQTETNTAVTVAYYSGQVRACRWGPLNAGATAHQCLRSRGTCCDHRWWLAIYTHTYIPKPTHKLAVYQTCGTPWMQTETYHCATATHRK